MDLREVLTLACKFKALRIKVGDIEVVMSPQAWGASDPVTAPIEEGEKPPTEDELLFWSTK